VDPLTVDTAHSPAMNGLKYNKDNNSMSVSWSTYYTTYCIIQNVSGKFSRKESKGMVY